MVECREGDVRIRGTTNVVLAELECLVAKIFILIFKQQGAKASRQLYSEFIKDVLNDIEDFTDIRIEEEK